MLSPLRSATTGRLAMTLTLGVAALALIFSAVLVSPLGAHSEVFERAPIAGQAVGGVVDQVDVSFWAPVISSRITIVGPDGIEIEAEATSLTTGDRIASTTFPELTEEGRYVVTHAELSADGDLQSAEWFFVFEAASENRLIPLSGAGGEGPNWILILAASGVILILAGVLWPKRSKTAASV